MRSVVIFSGGLDSTVLLCREVAAVGPGEVVALSFNYGQRHGVELEAAGRIAWSMDVTHRVVEMSPVRSLIEGSSQTSSEIEVPKGHYEDPSMRQTVVPNRNMIMISLAVGHAVSIGAQRVLYGAHSGDHPVYPDCRPEFVESMNVAIDAGNYHPAPRLEAPFLLHRKEDIVLAGRSLGAPMEDTWSCYDPQPGPVHCGRCGTCTERIEAFSRASVSDPTRYSSR